jgi:hypothetical protein
MSSQVEATGLAANTKFYFQWRYVPAAAGATPEYALTSAPGQTLLHKSCCLLAGPVCRAPTPLSQVYEYGQMSSQMAHSNLDIRCRYSVIGRTRTLPTPTGNNLRARVAFFGCSNLVRTLNAVHELSGCLVSADLTRASTRLQQQ